MCLILALCIISVHRGVFPIFVKQELEEWVPATDDLQRVHLVHDCVDDACANDHDVANPRYLFNLFYC